jgi:hypothetical protein
LHACRLNFRLRDSCKDDLATLCPEVCKDATKHACGGRALRCLTDNSAQIRSKACRDEVFYFEKMEVCGLDLSVCKQVNGASAMRESVAVQQGKYAFHQSTLPCAAGV